MNKYRMRSGFSLIRNGERLGYPYKEALLSLAPLVDELVVAHGDSTDNTGAELEALRPLLKCPLKIINSPWDPSSLKGGLELSRQTNIALDACSHDVCVYIQADEILHEDEYPTFMRDLARFEKDLSVDALAFQWIHFYGNYQTIIESRKWYRREIRAVRRSSGIRSFLDAQGFRIPDGSPRWKKPRGAVSLAHYRHYGWVRNPVEMAKKNSEFHTLWHGKDHNLHTLPSEVYPPLYGMKQYFGQHPLVMQSRVKELKAFDPFFGKKLHFHPKHLLYSLSQFLEDFFDWRPGEFRNFVPVETYDENATYKFS